MHSRKLKIWAAALTTIVLLLSLVGGVYAYLHANSTVDTNTFTPQPTVKPTVAITPTTPSGYQVDIRFPDPGYAVFVRVAIIVTWQNADGAVYAKLPVADKDYSLTCDQTNWFRDGNGFYYHKASVTKASDLKDLVTSFQSNGTIPPAEGYSLTLQVAVQTIQALGYTDADGTIPAVTDAWGVYVDNDGDLIPTPATS